MYNLYETIKKLCDHKGISVSAMCLQMGMSKSTMSDLKSGRKKSLSADTLSKIADFLGTSVDFLITGEQKEKAPVLTEKDERDIAKRMEALLEDLQNGQGSLAFSGEVLDDETRDLLIKSLRNSMEVGKALAKKKYTPKKYRKE